MSVVVSLIHFILYLVNFYNTILKEICFCHLVFKNMIYLLYNWMDVKVDYRNGMSM